jgi:hypothetical protein
MKVLFITQSGSLVLFEALYRELAKRTSIERAGFVVADAWHYLNWSRSHPEFEQSGHLILKEWDVTARRNDKPDLSRLRAAEQKLGDPGLFSVVFADRRWLMGPDVSYSQDYRRRFSDAQLLSMLQAAIQDMERLFDELKPDMVCGFICVTALEYLAYLIARSRGIRYVNLRASRIGNNVFFGSTLHDPTPEFAHAYHRVQGNGSSRLQNARDYIARVRGAPTRYEGTVAVSAKPAQQARPRRNPIADVLSVLRKHRAYRNSVAVTDNHSIGILRPLFFHAVLNPLRARRVDRALRPLYIRPDDLRGRRYAFFPLHTEPEVSLLVYGRPFVNQIEAIRAYATSLPADMGLVVKEHPWMVGKRKLSAYRKILDIPRVHFAAPDTDSRLWVSNASLVTVIGGSIGFEAAVLKVPVVTLGHVSFNILPDTMVRRVADLTKLPIILRQAIDEHRHDEAALEAFVAAMLEMSVDVNLYSSLLGRTGVFSDGGRSFNEDIAHLATYLEQRLKEPVPPSHPDAGPW